MTPEQQKVYEGILAEEYEMLKQYRFTTDLHLLVGEEIALAPEFPQPYAACAIMAMKRVHEMAIAADELIKITPPPVHIGELNRDYGYNGFQLVKKGAWVFEQDDRYFFMITSTDGKQLVKQTFYKEDLAEHINFINEPELDFD